MENVSILIHISLKFIRYDPVDSKTALVKVVVWHWQCDKPLPEAMMVQLIHIRIYEYLGPNV